MEQHYVTSIQKKVTVFCDSYRKKEVIRLPIHLVEIGITSTITIFKYILK